MLARRLVRPRAGSRGLHAAATPDLSLRVATFNVLAPIYKRLGCGNRESKYPELWRRRAAAMSRLVREQLLRGGASGRPADILCAQEWWCSDPYTALVQAQIGGAYGLLVARRTGNKQDGLAMLYRKDRFRVVAQQRASLAKQGHRVAQLVLLEDLQADVAAGERPPCVLVVNTHLTFPHHLPEANLQHRQSRRLTELVDEFTAKHLTEERRADLRVQGAPSVLGELDISTLGKAPQRSAGVVVCGDFNAEVGSPVWHHLVASGLVDSYDALSRSRTADPASAENGSSFVSHLDHRGRSVGVDHIFVGASHGVFKENTCISAVPSAGSLASMPNARGLSTQSVQPPRDMVPVRGARFGQLPALRTGRTPTHRGVSGEIHDATFYPEGVAVDAWPEEYDVSDHRPLAVDLTFRVVE